FNVFRQDNSYVNLSFDNLPKHFNHIQGNWPTRQKPVNLTYRGFPGELTQNYTGYEYFGNGGGYGFGDQGLARGEGAFLGDRVMLTAAAPAPGMPGQGGFGGGMAKGVAREAAQATGGYTGDRPG